METTSIIIGILLGVLVGWVLFRIIARKQIQNAKKLSNKIKEEAKVEAKVIKKEAELTVKEEWYKKQAELEKEIEKRKNELYELEKRYRDRLSSTEERLSKLDRREQSVTDKERFLERKQNALNEKAKQLDLLLEQENAQLVKVSGMTRDEAIQKLLQRFEQEAMVEAAKIRKSIIDDAKSEAKQEAIKILATAIQRTAVDYTIETCVSIVSLPSEEMKGRIIGREGRNIRTFENLTGIELIVDDTPETVVLSGFDPIRREIAKLALERLVADGRIHPGRIEELVKKAEEEINQVIKEAGREACVD
ncbi:MAG: Rnase Y domain-containing protein, partial [Candidatus Cloacimonadia bacterium]